MPKIVFAAISPHPPIILSSVGSEEDRAQVKNTIESLEKLGKKLKEANPDSVIISAPHPDWGFNVPLYFLAEDFKGKVKTFLIGLETPEFYFSEGKKLRGELFRGKACFNRFGGFITLFERRWTLWFSSRWPKI